jgi:predicted phage terminase large subunit-like protein
MPESQNTQETKLEQLRQRCKTDLYFLSSEVLERKDLLRFTPLKEEVHRPMCELFLKIDPAKGFFEQNEIKTRLLLAPRGCFKTTIDQNHIVQLILNFPNIRILILTGSRDRGVTMIGEIKKEFQTNDKLRAAFPEFCPPVDEKWGSEDEFTCPARTCILREPTVSCSSIESVKAGSHYDFIKYDDVVTEINSRTDDQLRKVIEAVDHTHPLLEPDGYRDFIGTRYHPDDLYGELIRRNEKSIEEGYGEELKVVKQSAWAIKPDRVLKKDEETGWPIITKDDVDLLFPERLTFKNLNQKYRSNPEVFSTQYLNDAVMTETQQFSIDLLRQHTIPYTDLPQEYETFCAWDLAGVRKKSYNDRCVGVVGHISKDGQLYIVDMIVGRFNAVEQAAHIVELARRNRPQQVFIEDAAGSLYLEPQIVQIAQTVRTEVPIKWIPAKRVHDGKLLRIGNLKTLLLQNKLWFAAYLEKLDDLYTEFVKVGRCNSHDDIPDAISLLANQIPQTSLPMMVGKQPPKDLMEKMIWKAVFDDEAKPVAPAKLGPFYL